MDFLDYLVKKSEINGQTEYFNYKKTRPSIESKVENSEYKKIDDNPLVDDYVVFDLETTGFKPGINAIIEIGAVKVLGGRIINKFSTLVNPEQYIPGYLSSKLHITNKMVEDKPIIDDILPDFISFIGNLPLVAHNARFDMSFLIRNCSDLGIKIDNCVIDTLTLSKRHLPMCKKHNLSYLTSYFNIPLDNAHRAYYDAYATAILFEIIKKEILNKGI